MRVRRFRFLFERRQKKREARELWPEKRVAATGEEYNGELWAGGVVEYQSEAYSSQCCLACSHTTGENRKTQSEFVCVECEFSAHADDVAAQNQLQKFLRSDKGVALLASGYRASANSLPSGRSGDSGNEAGTHRRGCAKCISLSMDSSAFRPGRMSMSPS